jgi:predicted RNase H-like nuclease (RuvC/YqgF family)
MSTNSTPTPVSPTIPPRANPSTDFRRNVESQRREQKSFGNLLATLTYLILIGLIVVTALATLGGYQVWQRLNEQASTVTQLDAKYEAAVTGLEEELKRGKAQLDKLEGQLIRQQEQASVLRANLEKQTAELRTERALRLRETAALQRRLTELEGRPNPFSR